MERLTKYESIAGHAHAIPIVSDMDAIMMRLAAYEDTGLTPEEVLPKDKADEIALKLMRLADLESICSYDRLRELAEADKAAADVAPVVPCKDCKHSYEDIGGRVCAHGVCVDCSVPDDFFCALAEQKDVNEK